MQILYWSILIVYGALAVFVFLYSIIQFSLALNYFKSKKQSSNPIPSQSSWPKVTVQLPIYNEKYVVERLVEAVLNFDYPMEKMEIQILDDSTDETSSIIDRLIHKHETLGFNILHLRRELRTGFKAGALKEGTELATGEFIAIFDADFIPKPSFLKETLPYFGDNRVGMVQTKWLHLNSDYNLLTKLQAFGLNAHFSVEQVGRNVAGHLINFNGTAGIWRKRTIIEAGGWQSDTLTEDLDLSYRAQLKGWKFKFLESHGSPAELPAAIKALKTQQYRWNKGAAECAVKNLPKVLKSELPISTKIHATFHLMNSFIFVSILFTGLLSVPLLFIKQQSDQFDIIFQVGTMMSVSFLFIGFFYWLSAFNETGIDSIWRFLSKFPVFLSIFMGLSLHNSFAVLEGYFGRKSSFIRTPKFNITSKDHALSENTYLSRKMSWAIIPEIILTLFFIWAIAVGFKIKDNGLFVFHLMLSFGFGTISYFEITQSSIKKGA